MTPIRFSEFLSKAMKNGTLLHHARRIVIKEERIDAFRTSSERCLFLDTRLHDTSYSCVVLLIT